MTKCSLTILREADQRGALERVLPRLDYVWVDDDVAQPS
jgi:hypothetical protein